MKKVVIAGSSKLENEIKKWITKFENENYEVINYPKSIEKEKFMGIYPQVHKKFFQSITMTDILFIMNEDKDNISGYIGYETFAELIFGLTQKLIYNQNIELILYKMPSIRVGCYSEIERFIQLGWIKLYNRR